MRRLCPVNRHILRLTIRKGRANKKEKKSEKSHYTINDPPAVLVFKKQNSCESKIKLKFTRYLQAMTNVM